MQWLHCTEVVLLLHWRSIVQTKRGHDPPPSPFWLWKQIFTWYFRHSSTANQQIEPMCSTYLSITRLRNHNLLVCESVASSIRIGLRRPDSLPWVLTSSSRAQSPGNLFTAHSRRSGVAARGTPNLPAHTSTVHAHARGSSFFPASQKLDPQCLAYAVSTCQHAMHNAIALDPSLVLVSYVQYTVSYFWLVQMLKLIDWNFDVHPQYWALHRLIDQNFDALWIFHLVA